MATNFSTIYDRALSKIREYAFLDLEDEQIYAVLSPFLTSAEDDFRGICVEDLTHEFVPINGEEPPVDETDEEVEMVERYIEDLSSEVIEILALGVVSYWMSAYVADSDKLRNLVSTKDYSFFSPANLLNSVSAVRGEVDLTYHAAINRYSYIYGDLIRPQAPHKRWVRR